MKWQHAIELVETSEVRRLGKKKLGSYLTTRELAYCAWNQRRHWEHAAARIAAKRALRKIAPQAAWLEMEIHKEESGKPYFQFTGRTGALLKRRKIKQVHLSLSHTPEAALASLICQLMRL